VLAALACGVQVVLVICKDPWRDLIKHISPSSEIMLWSDITSALSGIPTVDFCFSDEDFSQGKLKSLWFYVQHCIVVARPARRPPANWYHTPIQLSHFHFGGVMDASWILSLYACHKKLELTIPPQGG
jgi:hypothetical protein